MTKREMGSSCGKVYLEVAKTCLNQPYWFDDMSTEEKEALLARANYEEIEAKVGAEGSISTAVYCLFHDVVMSIDGMEQEDDYLEYVLHGTPRPDVESCLNLEKGVDFNPVEVLSAIHDRWVADNPGKFFDPNREGKRFMFLPLGYLGLDTVLVDFIYLEPILADIQGLDAPEDVIARRYEREAQAISAELDEGKGPIQAIADHVSEYVVGDKPTYAPLTQEIVREMRKPETLQALAEQVAKRNPLLRA